MIAAEGLTKYYGDHCAVQDVSFEIGGGEVVGILGLNGAGKTTTLRILACLLLPSAGRVRVNGLDITESPHEIRKLVGFLPEEPPIYQEMTVESFLVFAGEIRGLSRVQAYARVEEVLRITHTKEVRHQVIGTLSHGFRQRVGIAQAIVHRPAVLILDEPISGLDPKQIIEMREMIRGLKGRHTILVSSHILPEISQTCDRILVIDQGKIIASGTEEQLGGDHLQLQVRGEADAVLALLRRQPHVKEAAIVGTDNGLVSLQMITEQDVREAISREIVQAGFGLLQISAETKLEAIFMQLTQRKEGSR